MCFLRSLPCLYFFPPFGFSSDIFSFLNTYKLLSYIKAVSIALDNRLVTNRTTHCTHFIHIIPEEYVTMDLHNDWKKNTSFSNSPIQPLNKIRTSFSIYSHRIVQSFLSQKWLMRNKKKKSAIAIILLFAISCPFLS